jgi:hypothetical protein
MRAGKLNVPGNKTFFRGSTMKQLHVLASWLILMLGLANTLIAADTAEISNSARNKGMKEAPDLIKSSGLICSLADARLVESGSRTSSFAGSTMAASSGSGSGGGGGGGGGGPPPVAGGGGEGGGNSGSGGPPSSTNSTQYELACTEGLGYLVTVRNKVPDAVPCLELEDMSNAPQGGPPAGGGPGATGGMGGAPGGGPGSGPGSGMGGGPQQGSQTRCVLPGNTNQTAALIPFVIKAGLQCSIARARGIGHTASNTLFEVACDDNNGYILATSLKPDANQSVQPIACADLPENSKIRCTLSDPRAALLVADALMAKSGKACQVTDRRAFGSNASGDKFYEVSCQEGTGYVVQQTATGDFGQAVTCTDIGAMAGGCQLAGNKR